MAAFYNTATLSYRDTSTNSNTVEGQLVQVLAAEKTAVLPTYGSSNTVTYIVSIRNSGAAAYTGLTVTDDLGGYAFAGETRVPLTYVEGSLKYYSNGTLQPAPAVTAGAPLVIGVRPYFFLSFIRGSLVKNPFVFKAGLYSLFASFKALAIPCLIAPA